MQFPPTVASRTPGRGRTAARAHTGRLVVRRVAATMHGSPSLARNAPCDRDSALKEKGLLHADTPERVDKRL